MTRYSGRTHDYISFAYAIEKLPRKGVSRRKFLETLIEAAESGRGTLPKGWSVTWKWRNRADDVLRKGYFATVVRESRAQFLQLMGRRLRRDLRALGFPEPELKPIREATEREAEMLEDEREPFEEINQEREIQRKRKKCRAAKRKSKSRKRK
ncbi:MAG: hypothetical protein C5B59_12350 [Bacteroidetes bacterium]|nr:MAG: hypothetical protein C5B59_12350 [Bacteroidota bacterium]